MDNKLTHIFQPRSIAIVGASPKPDKLGHILLANLRTGGYDGQIYPVNPNYSQINDLTCYPSLLDIPGDIDQVSLVIPASGVLEAVKQAATRRVHSLIIISAGFAETGTEGKILQDTIVEICKSHNITLIGPNVIGLISPLTHFNHSWMQTQPTPGHIAFASQSGALCCSLLDYAAACSLGFAYFCSLGNKAGLDELDLFSAWDADPQVQVIGAYLEDIKRGHELVDWARTKRHKPLVIFLAGQSSAAASAVASHTASLTSNRDITLTGLCAAGAIIATSISEFFEDLQAFSATTVFPAGPRVQLVTNAGGAGIIATDAIETYNLQLSELNKSTYNKLKEVLPASASVSNPLDILGDALATRYRATAEILGTDPNWDTLLFLLTPQHVTQPHDTAQIIADFAAMHPEKLVVSCFIGAASVAPGLDLLRQRGLLAFTDPTAAVRTIAHLTQF
ncbi:CoA-binding protein, partial [bacterium]|nr:CoA-binding protein [bacterium]